MRGCVLLAERHRVKSFGKQAATIASARIPDRLWVVDKDPRSALSTLFMVSDVATQAGRYSPAIFKANKKNNMSDKNPNVNDVLTNSIGITEMRNQLCKSYLNLAKGEFFRKYKRKATTEDSQVLYDLYEAQWRNSIIDKPLREKANREKGRGVWRIGIKYKIDVYHAMCRFVEYKYSTLVTGKYGNTYYDKSCADLLKEMNIEFMESHIVDNGLLKDWEAFVNERKEQLPKYRKARYVDYSHLAYNGVTDDF